MSKRMILSGLRAYWEQLSARERGLVLVAAAVCSLAMVYLLGLRPALHTLEVARRDLPQLQAQAASLAAVLQEAAALKDQRQATLEDAAIERALRAAFAPLGSESTSLSSAPHGAGRHSWELVLTRAPAAEFFAALASLPRLAGVQVSQLDLERSRFDGRQWPGLLDGRLVLRKPSEPVK